MPLGLTAQTNIAFKNLLGKSETYLVNGLTNEPYGISFNLTSNNVWLNQLPTSATQAVANGYAIAVTGSMVGITSSNGHAYIVNWPSVVPTGIDPITSAQYVYNVGSLVGINSGNTITSAIPDSYGNSYTAQFIATDNSSISSSDSRNWVYQYNSGIYFQEYVNTPNPSLVSLYVYIGQTLQSQPNTPYTSASYSEYYPISISTI